MRLADHRRSPLIRESRLFAPALAIHDLKKAFGDLQALKAAFSLMRGERLAFSAPMERARQL